MIDRELFYSKLRASKLFISFNQAQVNGINAIFDAWQKSGLTDKRWLAYCLATTHHETAATMQPIEEYGKGKGRPYGSRLKMSRQPYFHTKNIFYGRGFVQLTWYENYEKAGIKLKQDFISNPDKVMEPKNAADIMFIGMTEGWFTGRKLSQYFNENITDWVTARKIINGMDKAELIAGYAEIYYRCLT